jgi:hypothetical protein
LTREHSTPGPQAPARALGRAGYRSEEAWLLQAGGRGSERNRYAVASVQATRHRAEKKNGRRALRPPKSNSPIRDVPTPATPPRWPCRTGMGGCRTEVWAAGGWSRVWVLEGVERVFLERHSKSGRARRAHGAAIALQISPAWPATARRPRPASPCPSQTACRQPRRRPTAGRPAWPGCGACGGMTGMGVSEREVTD